ncbi:DUF559 domain-containing protein [Lysinibacillus sp. NPDC093712]|uniref:DUF559 domain-containing protein n=1 Tax=unclassified Lysinibacillus TaxID=2636778 RepID=UPI0037F6ACC9
MEVYDAKQPQTCLICGFKINHNKQGWFTTHLKNEHNLTLDNYLISHFYPKEMVTCQYVLCNNVVKLRRGVPNKFCSRSCRGKGEPLTCVICGKLFDEKHRQTKTCSKECASKLRSQNTGKWHKKMSLDQKKIHFKRIISKTAKTRKLNGTPSWNSGKTGIYSQETIEKIRQAALKQIEGATYRKTSIERTIESFLLEESIPYKYSFILDGAQFDFHIVGTNILIECDGDFWHGNPKFYSTFYSVQKRIKARDIEKNQIAAANGFRLLRFWEDDIKNDFENVKKRIINALLATT